MDRLRVKILGVDMGEEGRVHKDGERDVSIGASYREWEDTKAQEPLAPGLLYLEVTGQRHRV